MKPRIRIAMCAMALVVTGHALAQGDYYEITFKLSGANPDAIQEYRKASANEQFCPFDSVEPNPPSGASERRLPNMRFNIRQPNVTSDAIAFDVHTNLPLPNQNFAVVRPSAGVGNDHITPTFDDWFLMDGVRMGSARGRWGNRSSTNDPVIFSYYVTDFEKFQNIPATDMCASMKQQSPAPDHAPIPLLQYYEESAEITATTPCTLKVKVGNKYYLMRC